MNHAGFSLPTNKLRVAIEIVLFYINKFITIQKMGIYVYVPSYLIRVFDKASCK
jgi:hypothetical protein